jgi:hypothetical protein
MYYENEIGKAIVTIDFDDLEKRSDNANVTIDFIYPKNTTPEQKQAFEKKCSKPEFWSKTIASDIEPMKRITVEEKLRNKLKDLRRNRNKQKY